MKILLLLGKKNNISELAYNFLEKNTEIIDTIYEDQKIPENIKEKDFEYLISFLNPKIIKDDFLLEKKCINFHPSLPKYRGVCCASLALLNNDKIFGATMHILNKDIDKGEILNVREIEIYENEDCYALSFRAKIACLELLYELINYVKINNKILSKNNKYVWGDTIMTYKKFNKLITFTEQEIEENKEYFLKIKKCVQNKYFNGPYIL